MSLHVISFPSNVLIALLLREKKIKPINVFEETRIDISFLHTEVRSRGKDHCVGTIFYLQLFLSKHCLPPLVFLELKHNPKRSVSMHYEFHKVFSKGITLNLPQCS